MVIIVSQRAFSKEEISFEDAFEDYWFESVCISAKIVGTSRYAILKESANIKIEDVKTIPMSSIGESLKRHLIA